MVYASYYICMPLKKENDNYCYCYNIMLLKVPK